MNFTSVVCASYSSETLLSGSIPDLEFADQAINLMSFESKIDPDGRQVVLDEVTVTESQKER